MAEMHFRSLGASRVGSDVSVRLVIFYFLLTATEILCLCAASSSRVLLRLEFLIGSNFECFGRNDGQNVALYYSNFPTGTLASSKSVSLEKLCENHKQKSVLFNYMWGIATHSISVNVSDVVSVTDMINFTKFRVYTGCILLVVWRSNFTTFHRKPCTLAFELRRSGKWNDSTV